jgi:hypothetical protein
MSLPLDRPGPVIMPVDKTAVAPPPEPTSQVETPPAEKPQSLTAPVAPRVPSAIDTAGKQESEAISDRAKAETAKAEAAQALLDKQAQTAQEIETKRLERQKANDAQIDGLNGWLKDPKNQVDAGRWWSSKSTGQKVGAGLSMILGGLGQGLMRGGRNVALDVIDKQIDQDIDSQKENINNKKSLVAMYMNQGHTIDSAAEMARASLLSITKAQLDAKANLAVGPEQQAQLKSAQAELAMKIQAAKQSSAASQASVDHERWPFSARSTASWSKSIRWAPSRKRSAAARTCSTPASWGGFGS